MIDLHVHTSRCGHASGTVDAYVRAAARAGVRTLGFADHLPLPDGFPEGYAMGWPELPSYAAEIRASAEHSAAHGGPEVLLGVEADWLPGHEMLVAGAIRAHPFDYVLGSVHFIDGWAFDDPDHRDRYAEWTADALWARYFEEFAAAAASGLYHAMAHPDLVKKFGFMPDTDPTPLYEEAAAVLAECEVAFEVNTAGLRRPCAELYPSTGMILACHRRGVPATMGSDAHAERDVGAGLVSACEALRQAGFRSVLVWRRGQAEEVPL